MLSRRAVGSKRRWGYLVWVGAALMLAVPEVTATISNGALGFVTASETIGHIERHHNWVELGVIGTLVLLVFSLYKTSSDRAGEAPAEKGTPTRTRGGRLTFHPKEAADTAKGKAFEDEDAQLIFALCAVASAGLIAFGGWAATRWWDDRVRFHASFVIYVSVAMLWFVIPSLVALFTGNDVPYPTMVRTVGDLSGWLKGREWPWQAGPKLAWFVVFVVLWGLAILFLHLTLYPFPDITKIVNPTG